MRPSPLSLALTLAAAVVAGCAEPAAPAPPASAPGSAPPYRLDAPAAVVELAPELREISGLTILPSGNLGAVQDESGTVYELSPATGQIVDRLAFGGPGDFEGVELTPDAVWALRSDGDLYRVGRDSAGAPVTRVVETRLRGRNDTEGLAYDGRGRLLIACKEWPGPDLDGVRAVYAFDLATETVAPEPVALLDRRQLDGRLAFKPSALAVHPISREVYVLSSVREAIAVLSPGGALVSVLPFPDGLVPQPEGITFAPDGTLYVSSEGPRGPGLLLRYPPAR